ncbi:MULTISPECIES: GNAT family N-acetyltransferase [unclassified Paenibacillus]|uniref:GNAT family N-acetyltransferase n=1 Tax=unclassified Paenibacillus TaxID=185978 RepID=UPI0009550173|nr:MULTISPECIES: GNAT family N-acetyltransferase [unclassified Paenibacillus]ASS64982.1 GNAT family N-acetyltransferase [Paenibacillus sp. RUD330]SIQ52552.1 ribosomal-protein-serine acetyltransferase [Paenibacillus sp. RU4X]SIQ74923.1 ribosomal-protein-serine acetyltransferase [Paenibacillus sp. RU4T]
MFSCQLSPDLELRLLESRYARPLFRTVQQNRDCLDKWLPWVKHIENVDDMKDYIEFEQKRRELQQGFSAIILEGGNPAGVVSYQELDWRNSKASLGYWLSADCQGRGIMTLACKEMVQYAIVTLEMNRVEIRSRSDNVRSRSVAERLGFTLEGLLRQEERSGASFYDHAVYGMVASEWDRQKRARREAAGDSRGAAGATSEQ